MRGYLAYDHLSSAQKRAPEIASDLGDLSAAGAAIDDIARHTAAARDLTSDPLWQGAEGVAWIGPQLSAVADVAAAVDDVVTGTARPIASVAVGFGAEAFVPVDGRIDTSAFAALADPATDAAGVAASARGDVAAIDRTPLVAPIVDAVDQLGDALSQVAAGTHALARASRLLPSMLGGEGARNHLLLVQNNAEWRTLGGIVGSMTPVRADDGRLALGEQIQARATTQYPESILDLGEYASIYQAQPGRFLQNITQVPDFGPNETSPSPSRERTAPTPSSPRVPSSSSLRACGVGATGSTTDVRRRRASPARSAQPSPGSAGGRSHPAAASAPAGSRTRSRSRSRSSP